MSIRGCLLRWRVVPGFVALVVLSPSFGCGETKHDVFMRAMEIEGQAERGVCALQEQPGAHAAMLSGDQVLRCLKETERALAEYDRAKSMGYASLEFDQVYARARARKERLDGMLEVVREMERDQIRAEVEAR